METTAIMENVIYENSIIYFISDIILILGLILSVIFNIKTTVEKPYQTAHKGPKRNLGPKRYFLFMIFLFSFMLIGFAPVFSDFLRLSFPNSILTETFHLTPFSPYSLEFLGKNIQITPLSMLFKFLIALSSLLTIVLGYPFIKKLNQKMAKFTSLFLFAIFGAYCMTVSNDFLSLFVSTEILSMALYFTIACFLDNNDKKALSVEASIKYFTLSLISSAFMLLGISYFYLTIGTVNFTEINSLVLNGTLNHTPVLNIAEILFFTTFVFKIGAYPFYIWVMDIFKGSNYSVGLFISTVLKIACIAAIVKIAAIIGFFGSILSFALILSAILTLVIGNLLALRTVKKIDRDEGTFKEFLAASAIANIGYIFLGIAFLIKDSLVAAVYYLIIYLIANFGLWAGFMLVSKNLRTIKNQEGNIVEDKLGSIRGLAYICPPFAVMFSIVILSFAAFPPMAGFIGKFFLFASILKTGIWAAYPLVFAGFASVLGVYYSFKLISIIFKKPDNLKNYKKNLIFDKINPYTFILSIAAALLIILFFFSSPVITMLNTII